jgi:hypothetical protein
MAAMNEFKTNKRSQWTWIGRALAIVGALILDFSLAAAMGAGYGARQHTFVVAAWVSFGVLVVGSVMFFSQQRFSLRTIFLVMTLIAVVLGLAVYAMRG